MIDEFLEWLNVRIMEYQHEYEESTNPREKMELKTTISELNIVKSSYCRITGGSND